MAFKVEIDFKGALLSFFGSEKGQFRPTDDIHEAKQTQTHLVKFELHLTEIAELMVLTQRFGPSNSSQAKYESLRNNLIDLYTKLRPFLLAYLRFDLEDERVGLRTIGSGTDAFQAIWVWESLSGFLTSDDVFFRDRVARAQDAIRDYTEHLHCLLETRV